MTVDRNTLYATGCPSFAAPREIPLAEYAEWFDRQPRDVQDAVLHFRAKGPTTRRETMVRFADGC